jgi:hypothetical protein
MVFICSIRNSCLFCIGIMNVIVGFSWGIVIVLF